MKDRCPWADLPNAAVIDSIVNMDAKVMGALREAWLDIEPGMGWIELSTAAINDLTRDQNPRPDFWDVYATGILRAERNSKKKLPTIVLRAIFALIAWPQESAQCLQWPSQHLLLMGSLGHRSSIFLYPLVVSLAHVKES